MHRSILYPITVIHMGHDNHISYQRGIVSEWQLTFMVHFITYQNTTISNQRGKSKFLAAVPHFYSTWPRNEGEACMCTHPPLLLSARLYRSFSFPCKQIVVIFHFHKPKNGRASDSGNVLSLDNACHIVLLYAQDASSGVRVA